jgi:hypothetical protein
MQPIAAPTTMKKIFLALALVSLVFSVACGSNGIGGLIGTGHYSNASLTGSYVYQITGYEFGSTGSPVQYQESGIFTANGHGVITSGSDDFAEETSGGVGSTPDTGTYSIGSDGTGTVTLTFPGAEGSISLDVTLVSTSKLYMIEADNANATGVAEAQSSTTLPTAATSFIFKEHSFSATHDFSSVGQLTLATDGTVTGSDDVDREGLVNGGGGTTNPLALTGSSLFNAPDSTGRGTATLTDSTGTIDFIYYIVNSSNLRLMVSDAGVVGAGRAEAQTGQPFTTDPLSGNSFAFGSRADDANAGPGAVNTVGSISASSGAISGGLLDTAVDGVNAYASVPINTGGTYTAVAANGRTVLGFTTLAPLPSTVQQVFWMVNPSRAFFLTTSDSSDITKIEDGTADEQQGTFTNSSLNGQYAFSMDGYDNNAQVFVDRVGWIQWKGNGNLTWNEAVNNSGGISSSGGLSGTYTVGTNGRTTASVSNLSYNDNDIVFYLVSGSNAYILENDAGVEINGAMSQQQ